MDTVPAEVTLHPDLLHLLFAHKSKTRAIFHEALTLHELDHIAIHLISPKQELLCFSSSPALEYNLFSSPLWRFDHSFNLNWIQQYSSATWQSLYCASRYDELYYLKQIKPHYPLGLSLATKTEYGDIIFSIASHHDCSHTQQRFHTDIKQFYTLGHHCLLQLHPLLVHLDQL